MLSLERVLSYRNDDVVARFSADHNISESDASEIFVELMRWLWFCAKRTQDVNSGKSEFFRIPLFNEAYAIDLMWHTFLLFTQDYANFCDEYFGFFIHHYPRPESERVAWQQRIKDDPEKAKAERTESLRKVYECICDKLGTDILIKWCEEFPVRFNFNNK